MQETETLFCGTTKRERKEKKKRKKQKEKNRKRQKQKEIENRQNQYSDNQVKDYMGRVYRNAGK